MRPPISLSLVLEHIPEEKMAKRYWAKVRQGPIDQCWLWTGATNRAGYGHLVIKLPKATHWIVAHRWGYYFKTKEDPGSQVVRHLCDNPPCQNPEHLMAGSTTDNNRDKSSLTIEDIRELREAVLPTAEFRGKIFQLSPLPGEAQQIADLLGVSLMTIHHILNYDTWLDE